VDCAWLVRSTHCGGGGDGGGGGDSDWMDIEQ
jgi:hypothetical protein